MALKTDPQDTLDSCTIRDADGRVVHRGYLVANFNPYHGESGKFASAGTPPGRVSLPADRTDTAPKVQEWKDPPPKQGKRNVGKVGRPTGEESQTKVGDKGEVFAAKLGFRNVLPEGKRNLTAAEVKKHGSSIDVEYDHSGRLYEVKLCNTTSTEYRLKAKAKEKAQKLKFARRVNATAYTMVAVRDTSEGRIHYYGSKEPGLIGSEVHPDKFDYFGSVKYDSVPVDNFNPYHGEHGRFAPSASSGYTEAHAAEHRALTKEGNALLKLRREGSAEAHHHERLAAVKARKRVLEAIQRGEVEGPAREAATPAASVAPVAPSKWTKWAPKDRDEAIANLKGQFNVTVLKSAEHMSDAMLERVGRALTHIKDRSSDPAFRAFMAQRELKMYEFPEGIRTSASGGDTHAFYQSGRHSGEYDAVTYHSKSMAELPANTKRPSLGDDWLVDASHAGIVRHEYGHHVHFHFVGADDKEWNALSAKYVGREGVLSKYGASDHKELFAEAFAAATHPGYRNGKTEGRQGLPKDIEDFFARRLGLSV